MSLDLKVIGELDAVNAMLELTGAAPVSSFPTSGGTSAGIAREILHRTSREIQGQGWSFNTDKKYPIAPDIDGHIDVPQDAIRIDPFYDYQKFVERYDPSAVKRRLYDTEKFSFVFTQTVYVDIVWFFAWVGLPDHARNLIYVMAGRRFQSRFQTSELMHQLTVEDETRARAEFMSEEMRRDDDTMINAPGSFEISYRRI